MNTALGREVRTALAQYQDISTLETIVCQRVAFAKSAATGQAAQEIDPNSTAAQEINTWVNLIENL